MRYIAMNGSSLNKRVATSEFDYVKKLTKHYSKSFYFSTQLLPPERRKATYALYGFCRYADNISDMPRDRTKKELHVELDHLARELETAYRTGESEHPIVKPFVLTAMKFGIPLEYPLDLIKGVGMDLYCKKYETQEQLLLFAYRVASTVGLMMTHVLGHNNEAAFGYARDLGIAMQLTNILRDIKEDKDLGRIYLPREDMAKFGVSEDDIMTERPTKGLIELMQYKVQEAHEYFERAQPGIPMLQRKSQYAIYSASRIYRGILYRIEDAGYNPFPKRVFVPTKEKAAILLSEYFMARFRPSPVLEESLTTRNV
jgi:15-cis-phytoene synthase